MIEQYLSNNSVKQNFTKGEILQRAGQEFSSAFYVKKGLLRSYTIDEKGKEHIFMFAPEGWIVSDFEKDVFGNETILFIDAIENSEIYVLDQTKLVELEERFQYSDQIFTSLMKRIGVMQRRILALMSTSAKERYESFLRTYPDLQNRIPQKMIASFLGVTPEALSKIRAQIVRNK